MHTQRALRLERILTLTVAFTLVFSGLCIYIYLVSVYESHWPPHLGAGSETHALFMLPTTGDLETFLLSSQEGHASSIVYFAQSAGASTGSADFDVEVKAFYESGDALRLDTRSIYALRRSEGQCGTGISQAGTPGHPHDDITLNITAFPPESHRPARPQHVISD